MLARLEREVQYLRDWVTRPPGDDYWKPVSYLSELETLSVEHVALSRRAFAVGAVRAVGVAVVKGEGDGDTRADDHGVVFDHRGLAGLADPEQHAHHVETPHSYFIENHDDCERTDKDNHPFGEIRNRQLHNEITDNQKHRLV